MFELKDGTIPGRTEISHSQLNAAHLSETFTKVFHLLCTPANVHFHYVLISSQNSIFHWVRDHRVHHKFSETDADPHNAKRGFFNAHVGWLMLKKHPEVLRRGKQVDMSDVLADPVVQFQEK